MSCSCEAGFAELDQYIRGTISAEHPQSTLILIMHFAQEKYGFLSTEVMDHISELTQVPTAEIYGVATFYSYFKLRPTGKHRVSVCMGTACYIRGGPAVMEKVQEELNVECGQTTTDQLFTLDQTRCIGACGLAPILLVDEKVFARVDPGEIKTILDEYRR